jgi:leucyl-tRNA synthetase
VLHPMGFDAFGLPAEQYAIETGQHPAKTTEENIQRYREQLDNIGFCFDWSREIRTSDPYYYKWTQWIFLQMFHSWYDRKLDKARPISELITLFEKEGNSNVPCPPDDTICFDARAWKSWSEKEKREALMHYRLAYLGFADVWWCDALGTVLANDEVVNGVSERGGFPVERRKMRQWFLRITEYADRLLAGLDSLEWSEAMKEMQRNWIGKSSGAEIRFDIEQLYGKHLTVFTTRPDTIFGVDFMVLAPEHEMVDLITTEDQKEEVEKYKKYVSSRSERERLTEVKQITGCFTGAFAVHPIAHKTVPIWISEYVLAGYGTGAIMAVPSGDSRDHAFAKHFNIPITNIFGKLYNEQEAYTEKLGKLDNSGFLTGIEIKKAAEIAIRAIEDAGAGKPKINYKIRDAGFSRQRYWGEPFPIVYVNDIPYAIDEPGLSLDNELRKLPVELPKVDTYKPSLTGEGPLANVAEWVNTPTGRRETSTMPGYAGSSWYFLRFMDPGNQKEFASPEATSYWREVDL